MFGLFKSDNNLALIKAAKRGQLKKVLKLLNKGADVNAKNEDGEIAIITATFAGHKKVVVELIRAGADVSIKDENGLSALMWAFYGRPEIVKDLLESGANITDVLIWTSSKGYTGVMEDVLKAGSDINAKDENGQTALSYAACGGHVDAVKLLLKNGADVNSKTETGETALMAASFAGQTNSVSLLLKAGADVNAKNANGQTALLFASDSGEKGTANLLLQKGAIGEYTPSRTSNPPTSVSVHGGFGEPYCSQECYDKGGKYISAVMLKNQTGVCGLCQSPVEASMYEKSNCAVVPYEGVNLFICNECTTEGKNHLRDYHKCCMCENELH